jgi:hypothetical protein
MINKLAYQEISSTSRVIQRNFNNSRVVKTGYENSVRTESDRFWRRVA